ncbi:response regulator [Sphaerotilus sp.]|uniref:PAS domain-containing hybrid sensor histidine kinase/response regulator n=1 Tax=Sphaerotilus sp. TaxID=2093942 RepID=UPI002ACE7239|nr:response regulator [Sphaerotilus sp.]MDZ7856336.1 response regulator [Sphaerotilus sp.]
MRLTDDARMTDHPWSLDICVSTGPAQLGDADGLITVSGADEPVPMLTEEQILTQTLLLARRLHRSENLQEGLCLVAPVLRLWLRAGAARLLRVSDWSEDGALVQPWALLDSATEELIDLGQMVTTHASEAPLGTALALLRPVLAVLSPAAPRLPWRSVGVRAVLALPVVHRHCAVAAIEFHDPVDLTPALHQLLELVGLHLGHLAARDEQTRETELSAQRLARVALLAARVGRGAVITDAQGVIEWAHPAFVQATGHSPGKICGRTLWDVLLGDADDQRLALLLRDCVVRGDDFVREFVARRGQDDMLPGDPYWLEIDAQVVIDETSGRPQVVCVCRDISDRKEREFGIDEGRALLGVLTEHIPISLVVLDAEKFRVVSLNRHAELEFCAHSAQVGGWDLDELLGAGVQQRVQACLQRAVDSHDAVEHEFERSTAEGDRVISARYVAVRNRLGRPTVVICQLRDVTQQRRDARQLRESEERYRELVESIDEGVFVTDPRRDSYFYIGARVYDMLGLVASQVLPHAELLPLRVLPEDVSLLEQQRRDELHAVSTDVTVRIRHPQRGVRWLRQRTRTRVLQGNETRVYGLIDDVSEERERELQLQAARDAAEAASRAKSQFMATMSHEIRTPMNGILGMTELLLGTALNARQRRFAQAVYRSGESLLEIINDVLDFAKIEAGKLELATSEFSLRSVVEDTLELLAPRAHEKGLELGFHEAPGLPATVVTDPLRVRQVLTNLVSNAIKFTEHGEITVSLRPASASAEGNVLLVFSVKDTGIGIAADMLPRLFNAFTQVHVGLARRYGGTGLGLAISRQLVELMGGEITVRSQPGVGSEFSFTLPVVAGTGTGDAALAQGLGDTATMPSVRVLVVDDHPTNRTVLENMLTAWGLRVTLVGDGEQALELLRLLPPEAPAFDLALIDWHMPGMDGIELAQRLRSDGLAGGMQLVLLSSVAAPDDVRVAQEAGFVRFIHKPVRKAELRQAILGIAAARQEAEVAMPQLGACVLVVEDNPVNQEVMNQMLQRMGCRVRVTGSALEGLRALCEDLFDLVLMDIQMPGMDGVEALQCLRRGATPRFAFLTPARTPVVAVTANALEGDEERFLGLGFDAYLSKPYRQGQLLAVLGRFVGARLGRRVRQEIEAAARTAPGALTRPDGGVPDGEEAADPTLFLALDDDPDPQDSALQLDAAAMQRLHDLDPTGRNQLVRRVMQAFDASISRLLPMLDPGPLGLDLVAVQHVAHTLRSSSNSLGALQLSALCAQMEQVLRRGVGPVELAPQLDGLRGEMQRVQDAVQHKLSIRTERARTTD